MSQYDKNCKLLRPFDLGAALSGEAICYWGYAQPLTFISGPDSNGKYVTLDHDVFQLYNESDLRMAPLGWVEGKPVYRDDVLYRPDGSRAIAVTGFNEVFGDALTWADPIGHPIIRFNAFPGREFYLKPSGCDSCENKDGTERCALFNVLQCGKLTGNLCEFGNDGSYFVEVDKSA